MAEQKNQVNANQTTGEIHLGKWINEAWDFVFANFSDFLLISVIYVLLIILASSTVLIKFMVAGPLTVGMFYVIFNKLRGAPIHIGDISKGFNFFIAAVLADVLISVFVALGFIFLIIPGIIISALYMFTFPLVLEKKLDFLEAMETSRKVVSQHIFELSVFMLVLYLFLLIGLMLLFVGFFVALPIVFVAIALAYRDIFGLEAVGK